MTHYVCPQCGSKYFKFKKNDGAIIVTVGPDYQIEAVQSGDVLHTKPEQDEMIDCAACSWSGQISELVQSDQ